jgi:hypothetical protein
MKTITLSKIAFVAAAAFLLASCGGGGDEAGAPEAFHITPDAVTVKGSVTDVCGVGSAVVFVYGGTAPYRLDNTDPADVAVDRSVVDHPGESFTVVWGNCANPALVVVKDALNNTVTLSLTSQKGD